jgi:hypothetical protein
MSNPGFGSQIPPGADWIARAFADMRREMNELRARVVVRDDNGNVSVTGPSIIVTGGSIVIKDASGNVIDTLDADGLTVAGGSVLINNGNLVVTGTGLAESGDFVTGASGWALKPNGGAEFNDLTLRGGIIGNDALNNPVSVKVGHADATNFSLNTTSFTEKKRTTITVPTGFTQALVFGTSQIAALNTTGTSDYFYLCTRINGPSGGYSSATLTTPGVWGDQSASNAALLTGLTGGGTFYVSACSWTNSAAWSADSTNTLNVDAIALFLR